ncbi:hypothetical protein D3C86_1852420 [compost metagenome]
MNSSRITGNVSFQQAIAYRFQIVDTDKQFIDCFLTAWDDRGNFGQAITRCGKFLTKALRQFLEFFGLGILHERTPQPGG